MEGEDPFKPDLVSLLQTSETLREAFAILRERDMFVHIVQLAQDTPPVRLLSLHEDYAVVEQDFSIQNPNRTLARQLIHPYGVPMAYAARPRTNLPDWMEPEKPLCEYTK